MFTTLTDMDGGNIGYYVGYGIVIMNHIDAQIGSINWQYIEDDLG